jgi:predicted porin
MLLAKYTNGPLKLYGGYEWIQFAPPSDRQTAFTDIAGDFVCAGCTAINNTNINNTAFSGPGNRDKILQVFWTGAKYAVTNNLDVMAGYYHYAQNNFVASGVNVGCASTVSSACRGLFDAVSLAVDWQFAKKFDAYAGIMFSQVNGGLANGFLFRNTIDPTAGLRFRF